MSRLFSVFDFLRAHKSALVILFCVLFVGFVDANSVWVRHFRWQNIDRLKAQIELYKARCADDSTKLERIKTDIHMVEAVAREKYYMTRPGEDIFIIQEGDELPVGDISQFVQDEVDEPEV